MTTIDHRRSPRIVKRVPLRLDQGAGPLHEAYSAVINLHGALVVTDVPFPDDTVLVVENIFNGRKSRARVVWSAGADQADSFKLGLEFLDGIDFWGEDYVPDVTV